jgi:hypothetical protein
MIWFPTANLCRSRRRHLAVVVEVGEGAAGGAARNRVRDIYIGGSVRVGKSVQN